MTSDSILSCLFYSSSSSPSPSQLAIYIALPLSAAVFLYYNTSSSRPSSRNTSTLQSQADSTRRQQEEKPKSIMQAPAVDLAPPKDDPFTLESLKEFDGSDESKPVYVSIKGTVFDVSHKRDTYGPGKSYGIFAGKDASKALGKSSLKPEDAVPDYSDLEEKDRKVLDDWYAFFTKRYNIVGQVTDHPVKTE